MKLPKKISITIAPPRLLVIVVNQSLYLLSLILKKITKTLKRHILEPLRKRLLSILLDKRHRLKRHA